jgi:hemolysin D
MVKLKPKRFNIRVSDKDVPFSPGMAVTAEIKTGERKVIEFFISPFIKKYVDESLTLR